MRVALSIPVELDGATFEFLVPDALMARLVPALMSMLQSVPDGVETDLLSGKVTDQTQLHLGLAMLNADLLTVACEAFDKGVHSWDGVELEDGKPLKFANENKQFIPMFAKLQAVVTFFGKQMALNSKKDSAT